MATVQDNTSTKERNITRRGALQATGAAIAAVAVVAAPAAVMAAGSSKMGANDGLLLDLERQWFKARERWEELFAIECKLEAPFMEFQKAHAPDRAAFNRENSVPVKKLIAPEGEFKQWQADDKAKWDKIQDEYLSLCLAESKRLGHKQAEEAEIEAAFHESDIASKIINTQPDSFIGLAVKARHARRDQYADPKQDYLADRMFCALVANIEALAAQS